MYQISYKTKVNIYKKFNMDLWGYYQNFALHKIWMKGSPRYVYIYPSSFDEITEFFKKKRDAIMEYWRKKTNMYIYSLDDSLPETRSKKPNYKFLNRILMKFYYMNIKYHQFSNWGVKVFQRSGFTEGLYILCLEGSVSSILYRMNFIYNIFWLKWIMMMQGVFVNKCHITYTHYVVKLFDIIQINSYLFQNIMRNMVKSMKFKLICSNTPSCLIVNYNLLFGFFHEYPNLLDLAFPSSIDMYSGFDFI